MNILLTGNQGWVGRKLMTHLESRGIYQVSGLDAKTYDDFSDKLSRITDGNYFDMVIHCGAISNSGETGNILWDMNYKATKDIGKYVSGANAKLVFISSSTAVNPDTPYGWSKNCAEFYLNSILGGESLSILRPYNIWGFDEHNKDNPSIIYKMMTHTLPQIYKGCVRDFVYVDDVVHAIDHLLWNWSSGVYEIGTSEPTNIEDFVNELYDETYMIVPKVQEDCPISVDRVALSEYLLPGWTPKPISAYMTEIIQFVQSGGYYLQ